MPFYGFDRPGELPRILEQVKDEQDLKSLVQPSKLDGNQRKALTSSLKTMFGTPLQPKVTTGEDTDEAKITSV